MMPATLDRQAAQFHRDGYLPGPIVLAGERLTAARDAVDGIISDRCQRASELLVFRRDRAAPNAQVHVVGSWRAEPALRDLAFDPVIVRLVCRLIGAPSVRLFRDQLFVKAPRSGTTVPWHQDYSDWTHTTPPCHVTCWVALDDASEANGCLSYVPGSHRGPLLPKITPRDDMASAFARLPASLRATFAPQSVPVPAGGCVLHHCLTVHGSPGNDTAAVRRAVAITYIHPDTRCLTSTRAPLPGVTPVPAGARLEGELFPELQAPELRAEE
jgi:ectoine hydroxylase-related dioxygenase (phytanoyl-CoA dioxygenase family)